MADLEDYKYPHIEPTDYIDESLEDILARDDAAKHSFRRLSSFPSVTNNDIGMKVYIVGQGNFQLIASDPEPQWKQLSDDSRNLAYVDWVIDNYQPISKLLTSLSKLRNVANALPYFNGPEDMQSIALSGYMKKFLALTDNDEIIDTLQLGSAAKLDYPIDGKYIAENSIPISALSKTSIQNIGFSTGDAKLTLKTTPDEGWVIADDGSIGSATSGATNRANADTYDLFSLLWNNPYCELQTFSGGATEKTTVSDDWKSNKRLILPKCLGRVLGVAGQGENLTLRDLGSYTGEESTVLTANHVPAHSHGVRVSTKGGRDYTDSKNHYLGVGFAKYSTPWWPSTNGVNYKLIEPSAQVDGEAGKLDLMQPTTFLNLMIKL